MTKTLGEYHIIKFKAGSSGLFMQPWGAGGSRMMLMGELEFVEFQNVVTKKKPTSAILF